MQVNQNTTTYSNYQTTKTTSNELKLFSGLIDAKPEEYVETKENLYKRTSKQINNYGENSYRDNLSEEQLIQRSENIQDYLKNDSEEFEKAKKEHNRRVREDSDYDPQLESKYFDDKRYYNDQDILLDGKIVHITNNELTMNQRVSQSSGNDRLNEWYYQQSIMTEENKYENAPEFEAFINKWIEKGETKDAAIERAKFYAELGLLDYGDQKVVMLENLEYGDKKQHAMHLIDNQALKDAMIETLDSLDNEGVGTIAVQFLYRDAKLYFDSIEGKEVNLFQELLNDFGIELEKDGGLFGLDSKKYAAYEGMEFTGDINITQQMSQLEKNFIYDALLEYFKYNINQIEKQEEQNNEEAPQKKSALNLLIKNFEENVEEENENNRVLSQYTRSNKTPLF